ncbi:MAG: hypothetical protein NTZ50_11140 [Chloroflexi bacterium]|nr:hypothetical protein [Chloroflexota bacterium]
MPYSQASYPQIAQAYAEGVVALLAPAPVQRSTQRSLNIRPYTALAAQARALLQASDALTDVASARLEFGSHDERVSAQLQLIAKALTDLTVSQHLLEAAEDEQNGVQVQTVGIGRSAALFEVDTYLKVIQTGISPRPHAYSAQRALAVDAATAQRDLIESVQHSLETVLDRSAMNGQAAFRGLVSIGLFNLAKAASIVGVDLAEHLGYGKQMSNLYELVNQYVGRAHETILTLLGRELSRTAVDRAMNFFQSLRDGSLLGELLERLYETQQTRTAVEAMVQQSGADAAAFTKATESITNLTTQFDDIMDFVGKLITGLKYVGMIPAATMPQAQLVMAASHSVLFTYIVLAGADFADSQRIKMLNRVPGVRDLIVAALYSKG